jgi:alcohol dehydrogenase, propanol-preferring
LALEPLPRRMTAMAFDGAGNPLKQVERTVAPPTRSHILLRVSACAVCRTDLHVI